MKQVILPDRYYLDHFFEWLEALTEASGHLMGPEHRRFVSDFRALSTGAQCVYVRMVNRKGLFFSKPEFEKYREIERLDGAFEELEQAGFARRLQAGDRPEWILSLSKAQLTQWLAKAHVNHPRSSPRESVRVLALASLKDLDLSLFEGAADWYRQGRAEELQFLLFLFFGSLQKTLSLYTLRDLGVRSANQRQRFQARYRSQAEALAEYRILGLLDSPPALGDPAEQKSFFELLRRLETPTVKSRQGRNELLLWLAEEVGPGDGSLFFEVLKEVTAHPGRERQVRWLWSQERKGEAQAILEDILEDPWCDEEILFAEDFLSRKFEGRKKGRLTQILQEAREIELSDAYFRKPEWGVCDFYRQRGAQAFHTENELWRGLFGLFFWDELFEGEQASIYNPFERSPEDLLGPEFYEKRKPALEDKLSLCDSPEKIQALVLRSFVAHHGKMNDFFQWNAELLPRIVQFLRASRGKNLAAVLRRMAQRYTDSCRGFPDVMVIEGESVRFIEVKAEGDALRAKQLSQFRFLREAGFDVEVLKVRWKADPDQVYVVVDVETTGGRSDFHRITEIGAVKIKNGEVIDEFQTLLHPGRSIPGFITRLTGITNEMVADAPRFAEIADDFQDFMKGAIFVAHNVRFDYGFIQREFSRLDQPFVRPQMCTCSGMRKVYPGLRSYSLKNLTDHFEIPMERHHRALSDARAAGHLLLLMNQKRGMSPELG